MTNSIGLAFQMGLGYKLDKNWSVNAGWTTAAVKNDIKIRTNTSEQTASYRFHPSVFSLTAGYQFWSDQADPIPRTIRSWKTG